jgi:dTDP-4-amino-4,6-dideoxygalactose transaminase
VTGEEFAHLADAVARGHLSGDGHYTKRDHELLAKISGVEHVLLTTSCTHALEMCASLLGTGPGDEVIVPSFTFVSSVNAFAIRGARPVFVDIRPDTLNLDEQLLEAAITDRTKAIVVVHYAGVACEMDAIREIAGRHGIPIVEDNAHGLGARYRGETLGTMGDLATLSFHETKNIQCGEGGALLTNRLDLVERAEILREKGTNRSQFFRGQIDKYTWVDVGSSYLPSDLLAAFLLAQLEHFDDIQAARQRIWGRYDDSLAAWAADAGVRTPIVPAHCEQPAHLYYLLLPTLDDRQAFIDHLRERDVQAVFHYVPLHTSPMGLELGGAAAHCPVTESVSDRLVRLPLFPDLSEDDQTRVIDAATSFRPAG